MKIETFVKRAMGKVDAGSFIREHRDFLCGFKSVRPILAMLENREMYPTPALQQILQVIITEKDPMEKTEEVVNLKTGVITAKTSAAVEKAAKKKEPKKYQLFLFVKAEFGGETVADTFDAPDYGTAMRDSYRILFQNEHSLYMDITGMGVTTRITRDQAVGEILRESPGGKMATKRTNKGGGSGLGWKVSAKQFVAKFSRG